MNLAHKVWRHTLTWVLCAVVAFPLAVAAVEIGDAYEDVIRQLGDPPGFIKTDTFALLYYERGTIRLEEDRVVNVELLSEEEAAEQRQIEREERARRQAAQQERQVQRLQEGRALRQQRHSDPDFLSASAEQQLAFWRQFRRRYPEVPVEEEYRAALERYEREQQVRRLEDQERRIRELEAQVRRAEERAAARPSYDYYHRPIRYLHTPVVYGTRRGYPVYPVRTSTVYHSGGSHRNRHWHDSSFDRAFRSGPFPRTSREMEFRRRTSDRSSRIHISF